MARSERLLIEVMYFYAPMAIRTDVLDALRGTCNAAGHYVRTDGVGCTSFAVLLPEKDTELLVSRALEIANNSFGVSLRVSRLDELASTRA